MVCPNKNDENYKILEQAFGPVGAYAVFEKMGMPQIAGDLKGKDITQESVIQAIQDNASDDLGYEVTPSNRALTIISNKKLRLGRLSTQITIAEKNNEFAKVAELKNQHAELTESLEDLEKDSELDNIVEHGRADMKFLNSLLDKDVITDGELDAARKITGTWIKAVDFMTDEEAKELDLIRDELSSIATEAGMLRKEFDGMAEENLKGFIRATLGSDFIKKQLKDINVGKAYTLDISHINDSAIQSLFVSIKKANMTARDEARAIMNNLERLTNNLKKKGMSMNQVYDMLAQEYADGTKTGAMIMKISADYQQEKYAKRRAYLEFKGKDQARFQQLKQEYVNFLKENEITMDPRKLLGENVDEDHKNELVSAMGEAEYERRLEFLKDKVQQYEDRLVAIKDYFIAQHGEGEVSDTMIHQFEIENSPYAWAEYLENPRDKKFKGLRPQGYKYTYSLPKNQEAYDPRFEAIEKDKDLREYYNFVSGTLRELHSVLPEDQKQKLKSNAIPFVKQSLLDTYNKQGFRAAAEGVYENFIKSNLAKEPGSTMYEYQDPATGEIEDYLRAPDLDDKDKVNSVYKIKRARAKADGEVITEERDRALYRAAQAEVASQKSFDFNKIVASYALLAKSYEHKSKIEDQVRVINHYVKNMEETLQKNSVVQHDRHGNPIKLPKDESFQNVKKAVGNHMDMVFFDKPKAEELVGEKKKYTPQEQKRKTELEELLESENISKAEKEAVQKELDSLGGKVAGSRILDNVMKWVQLKGMGYNPMGAISNVMFGNISNWTHAAGGEDFNMGDFAKANAMTLQTLSPGKKLTPTGRKIDNLMKRLDVLKDSSNEVEDGIKKVAGKFDPYILTKKTEYMNQAPVMVAMMMKQGVWEDYNEDGEYVGEGKFDEMDFRLQLDQVIKNLHGNYDPDSPLLLKKNIAGRMISQFRTWMFESVNNRFAGEEYDQILKRTKKGRWRSYKIAHAMVFPLLKDFYSAWTKGGDMSDVDRANMRKNSVELCILAGVASLMGLLLMGAEDDDEKTAYYNLAINMLSRAQDDILFYANPTSFENITKQLVPASSLMNDTMSLFSAAFNILLGGDDEIGSGTFAGDSTFVREAMQFFPGAAKAHSIYSGASQVYK